MRDAGHTLVHWTGFARMLGQQPPWLAAVLVCLHSVFSGFDLWTGSRFGAPRGRPQACATFGLCSGVGVTACFCSGGADVMHEIALRMGS